jgi:hypothetical protein
MYLRGHFLCTFGGQFHGGLALIIAVLASIDMAITMSIGAGLGLVIGSVVYGFKKQQQSK